MAQSSLYDVAHCVPLGPGFVVAPAEGLAVCCEPLATQQARSSNLACPGDNLLGKRDAAAVQKVKELSRRPCCHSPKSRVRVRRIAEFPPQGDRVCRNVCLSGWAPRSLTATANAMVGGPSSGHPLLKSLSSIQAVNKPLSKVKQKTAV